MTDSQQRSHSSGVFTPWRAILYGTLVAGALDAADGVVFFGFQGKNPIQVLQYIASGLLGERAFQGGLAAAALGVLIHFTIAFVVASIYVFASRRFPILRERAVIAGLLFGAAVYLVMNFVVLPITAVPPGPITTPALLNGLIGHALFVGLPIALFAKNVSA